MPDIFMRMCAAAVLVIFCLDGLPRWWRLIALIMGKSGPRTSGYPACSQRRKHCKDGTLPERRSEMRRSKTKNEPDHFGSDLP